MEVTVKRSTSLTFSTSSFIVKCYYAKGSAQKVIGARGLIYSFWNLFYGWLAGKLARGGLFKKVII